MADETLQDQQIPLRQPPEDSDAEALPSAAEEQSADAASAAPAIGNAAEESESEIPVSPTELGEEEPQPDADAEHTPAPTQTQPSAASPPENEVPPLPDFSNMLADAAASSIEILNDVDLNVKVELGRTRLAVNEILHLTNGYVVELDKLAGDPVDILVNEQLIARGEVLVVNDNFCVRINEIIPGVSEKAAQNVTG